MALRGRRQRRGNGLQDKEHLGPHLGRDEEGCSPGPPEGARPRRHLRRGLPARDGTARRQEEEALWFTAPSWHRVTAAPATRAH